MNEIVQWMPGIIPFCAKCRRQVESVEVERFMDRFENLAGFIDHVPTGKGVLTIRCHGESVRILVKLPR